MESGSVLQHRVLDEDPRHRQEEETTGCNIVQGSNRIQGDPFGCEEDLNHDQPGGLEGDGAELEDDAPGVETGFAVSGDGDAEGDGEHVEHGVVFVGFFSEEDADGVDGDGHEGLEHLDEGDGEVDVGGVGEPEGEGVEGADGEDGGEVEVT